MLRHIIAAGILLTTLQLSAFGQISPTYIDPGIPPHLQDSQNASDSLMDRARQMYADGMRESREPGASPQPPSVARRRQPDPPASPAPFGTQSSGNRADELMPSIIASCQNLAASGQIQSCFCFINTAIQQYPELHPQLLCLRARAFRMIGRFAEGWQDLDQAYQLAPGDGYVLQNRLQSRFEENNAHGALQEMNRIVTAFPDHAEGYRQRAILRSALGLQVEAAQDWTEFMKRVPAQAMKQAGRPSGPGVAPSQPAIPYTDADFLRDAGDQIDRQLQNELALIHGRPQPYPELPRTRGAEQHDALIALRHASDMLDDPNVPPEVKERIQGNLGALGAFEQGWANQQRIKNEIQQHKDWTSINNQVGNVMSWSYYQSR